jgi:hypothetical protein
MIQDFIKRLFDILISTFALVILTPILIIIAVVIKAESKGSFFYKGERAGKNGKVFRIIKFRSMIANAEIKGGPSTAENDWRLTRIGRFIRKYKLDELPQFFNVLKGEMSLVGPRPQVLRYTNLYKDEELLILSVRPGITDLASLYFVDMDAVLGSENVDARYQEVVEPVKNKLRLRYVKERSFIFDLRILLETLFRLIGFNNVTGLNFSP